ncbi:MAG: hypothetical protein ACJZ3J_03635 [Candidatus Poseidoniales archaeon]|uniref:Uncharacterized protein n=1 Tax=Marine Group III euryarchaeote CG-Epi1 TaxID=1888995 RepID=A0A1J5U3Y4_9ARCH|nr:MAG: hypothetical protein BD935_01215 [Marine Group III euryarchaeote CG-Epi1]|tara:strand:- start:543 stop:1388 length:846 start_codon:yes stop_codon:yes gene_type:complete
MQTSNTLAIMQSVATLSLMLSLSFAYLINPLEDSLFLSALDGFTSSLYNSNVINELNTSVIAGILVGLFLGTTNVLLSSSKKIYDYVLIAIVSFFVLIFFGYVFSVEWIPYEPLQQVLFWVFIGLPVSTGMVGIWQNKVGNLAVSAFLILSMPLGLTGNTNEQIYPILGFVFSFILYLELSYGHARYSRLARVMAFSKEYEDVLVWFLTTLMVTVAFTMILTSLAFLFHDLLGSILPYSFSNSIEYNTIYGQALSVLVFFMLWSVIQILFSRGYLARQVED